MKTLICRILAALIVALTLAGCQAIQEESAMEWMLRQPVFIDP